MIHEHKPLQITVDRWLVDRDQDAELSFEAVPYLSMAEMDLKWGSGPQQMRAYQLTEDDLTALYEWLGTVLGKGS